MRYGIIVHANSDAASELLLSKHLAEKNAILSSDWFYSTELRVLNTQLIYAPLFQLTNNWSAVRFVGAIISQGILVLSYWFFTYSLRISSRCFFYTAGLLILPTSPTYALDTLFLCYYIPHISLGFLIMALFNILINGKKKKKISHILLISVFCLLSLGSTLGGIRQFMVTFLPLLLLCFLLMLKPLQLLSPDQALAIRIRSFLSSREARHFGTALLGTVFALIGYFINTRVFSKYYSFFRYDTMMLQEPSFAALQNIGNGLMGFFGFRADLSILSLEGIASILGIVCFVLALYFSIVLFRRRDHISSPAHAITSLFFLSTLFVNTLIFLLSGNFEIRYYIPVVVFFFPLLAIVWENKIFAAPLPRLTKPLCGFVFAVFLLNSWFTAKPYLTRAYPAPDIFPVADFLQQEGYTFGYATFWNANIITEQTNGEVKVSSVIDLPTPHFYRWLTLKEYQQKEYHSGPYFLLLTRKEAEEIKDSELLKSGKETYRDDHYAIYSYPTNEVFAKTLDYLPAQ